MVYFDIKSCTYTRQLSTHTSFYKIQPKLFIALYTHHHNTHEGFVLFYLFVAAGFVFLDNFLLLLFNGGQFLLHLYN